MRRPVVSSLLASCCSLILAIASCSNPAPQPPLNTGRDITPPASFAQAVGSLPVNLVLTPDHRYAVTTDAGYRESLHLLRLSDARSLFHLDYPNSAPKDAPPVAKTNGLYYGLAIDDQNTLYAAQGANDSIAVIAIRDNKLFPQSAITTRPGDFPAGLALDHRNLLYVANQAATAKNDNPANHPGSIAIYNPTTRQELGRYSFEDSFFGTSNFPLALGVLPDGSKLYVASERDAAVYVLNTSDSANPTLLQKIPTGAHPSALLFTKNHQRLFVANADSDTISIINTATDTITATIPLRPDIARGLPGATPIALTLSPDESTLYVALADMNAVAAVDLAKESVTGYIPTGWYPSALTLTPRKKLLVLSAKGNTARNPNASPRHSPLFLLEGNAQLLSIPDDAADFQKSTAQVLANNHYDRLARPIPEPLASLTRKSGNITHIIYIIKENRTYDQVLGDLTQANGDPKLCLFPQPVTPNLHALAERFGILDNLYACGEVSGDGWNWSTESMANPYVIRNIPYHYSKRGRAFDFEGENNHYPTGGTPALGPDGKPLTTDTSGSQEGDITAPSATPAPTPAQTQPAALPPIPDVSQAPGGHIWDLCLAHKVPFRNYGFYTGGAKSYPTAAGLQPADHNLAGVSDIDYRQFDLEYPDSDAPALLAAQSGNATYLLPRTSYGKFSSASRITEFRREFNLMLENDPIGASVPALLLVRLPNDHTHGGKSGSHTPTAQVADNDYAVGQLVDAISHSPIWPHTAIFIIEDDAQDGPDHVDCHRTTGYVVSPFLAPSTVDHHFYNSNTLLRTMEILLDLPPMTQYDATATLIANWTPTPANLAPFTAVMPAAKYFRQRNPKKTAALSPEARRLADASDAMDFTKEDAAPAQLLNEIIWKSVKGEASEMPPPKTTHLLSLTHPKDKDGDDDD